MTTGRFLCFSIEKMQKKCKNGEKGRLRTQKKQSYPLQFTNNA